MKTFNNRNASEAANNVKDIQFFGDGDTFQLICKASSENEGWMKSTKGMQTPQGVVIQVSTQQRNPDGSFSIAEALTFVPCAELTDILDKNGDVTGREIV